MKVKTGVVSTVAVVLVALACGDVPGEGDSAGNNQPDNLPACAREASYVPAGEPAAQFSDGQYLYDVYAELQDVECNALTIGGQPLHFYISGTINGQPAEYADTANREKDVDSPYHMSAFVKPRGVPHDMVVLVNVNKGAFERLHNETDAEFVHCRILRDRAPIPRVQGSDDQVSHTVIIRAPYALANCHITVGVG